ncbi:MAG: right-handed parallel beta-helix repeat-containing protein, partial [Acidimicrobiales bacterium]
MRRSRWLLGLLAAVALLACACSSGTSTTSTATTVAATGSGAVIHVPADKPTIQSAVDAASPGDLILVSPGVYHEAVDVTTDYLDIRGTDRNTVILDGTFQLENGVRVLSAKGVAVENMTARNYTGNGFFWTGVEGYRGSYLTSFRTGNYGLYAFDSTKGQFDHSYASGSPDAGVYIGQCQPCDAVISEVTSEHNGLGYSGTNSGGNLLIVNSIFRHNRAGIVPNSGSYE